LKAKTFISDFKNNIQFCSFYSSYVLTEYFDKDTFTEGSVWNSAVV